MALPLYDPSQYPSPAEQVKATGQGVQENLPGGGYKQYSPGGAVEQYTPGGNPVRTPTYFEVTPIYNQYVNAGNPEGKVPEYHSSSDNTYTNPADKAQFQAPTEKTIQVATPEGEQISIKTDPFGNVLSATTSGGKSLNTQGIQEQLNATAIAKEQKAVEEVQVAPQQENLVKGPKPGEYGYHATKENPAGLYHEKPPLFDPVTGEPNARYPEYKIIKETIPGPEFITDPKYGLMLRKDIAENQQFQREQEIIKESVPSSIDSLSSRPIYELGEWVGKGIRSITIDTSGLPAEIKESPGYNALAYSLPLVRESTARIVEFGGMVIPVSELLVVTAAKEPQALPGMLAVGTISLVGSTAKQAQENPAQLVSDIVVSAAVFKGILKISKLNTRKVSESDILTEKSPAHTPIEGYDFIKESPKKQGGRTVAYDVATEMEKTDIKLIRKSSPDLSTEVEINVSKNLTGDITKSIKKSIQDKGLSGEAKGTKFIEKDNPGVTSEIESISKQTKGTLDIEVGKNPLIKKSSKPRIQKIGEITRSPITRSPFSSDPQMPGSRLLGTIGHSNEPVMPAERLTREFLTVSEKEPTFIRPSTKKYGRRSRGKEFKALKETWETREQQNIKEAASGTTRTKEGQIVLQKQIQKQKPRSLGESILDIQQEIDLQGTTQKSTTRVKTRQLQYVSPITRINQSSKQKSATKLKSKSISRIEYISSGERLQTHGINSENVLVKQLLGTVQSGRPVTRTASKEIVTVIPKELVGNISKEIEKATIKETPAELLREQQSSKQKTQQIEVLLERSGLGDMVKADINPRPELKKTKKSRKHDTYFTTTRRSPIFSGTPFDKKTKGKGKRNRKKGGLPW